MITGTFDLSSQDAVSYDGKVHPTASHLFEAMRFLPHRPDIAESIRMCDSRSTHDAENISFRNDDHVRVDWKQVLIEKMDEVNYLKFTQNEHIMLMHAQRTLLMTGHMKLVYYYWKGYSSRNGGAEAGDQLGRSLMRVRDKLRGE
ncbi:hypothetical protein OF83DRAFT_1065037 [Amylostereum chailletii]|nr:hypothetical protein OF83DRAFT_1065037 [Amylostereum chailletii]